MGVRPLKTISKRAVFLDRDGVVNTAIVRSGRPYPPQTLSELTLNPDAYIALPALKALGFLLIVVTNQPDVKRGSQCRAVVESMHQRIRTELPIDDFFVCYHDDEDGCHCRKPKPGLLLQAAERYAIECDNSFLIGDRWRDIDAGHSVSCSTIWIDYGYVERAPSKPPAVTVRSLIQAAEWITGKSLNDGSSKTI
jgi:D-glycero-D-manno-heptose 1,7-bisphosphate phosphatase